MMKKILKSICAFALCLLLLPSALADDCFTIDVDALDLGRLNSDDYVAQALSAGSQGVRVRKYISSSSEIAASVRLTLMRMDSRTLLFDKDYGYQSGVFDSGVIYLPYLSDSTAPYLITLYVGDYVYAIPFMHQQRRLESNGACTVGVRLRDLDPAQSADWLMGTMVDLAQLRRIGSCTVELCASNSYVIGSATISLIGSRLNVQLHFSDSADVVLEEAALYVLTDGQYLSNADSRQLNESVDVSGAQSALIYLPMQVSYDPAGLPSFTYDLDDAHSQQRLWSDTRTSRSGGSSGGSRTYAEPSYDASGWDDGWSSGWDDGWSDGWDDGWSSGW